MVRTLGRVTIDDQGLRKAPLLWFFGSTYDVNWGDATGWATSEAVLAGGGAKSMVSRSVELHTAKTVHFSTCLRRTSRSSSRSWNGGCRASASRASWSPCSGSEARVSDVVHGAPEIVGAHLNPALEKSLSDGVASAVEDAHMGVRIEVRDGESVEQAAKRFNKLVWQHGPPGAGRKRTKWHKRPLDHYRKPSELARRDR